MKKEDVLEILRKVGIEVENDKIYKNDKQKAIEAIENVFRQKEFLTTVEAFLEKAERNGVLLPRLYYAIGVGGKMEFTLYYHWSREAKAQEKWLRKNLQSLDKENIGILEAEVASSYYDQTPNRLTVYIKKWANPRWMQAEEKDLKRYKLIWKAYKNRNK